MFVGPSGCGKFTLLRMIAGLKETSCGCALLGKGEGVRDVTGLPPSERGLSMIFQSYALCPHMSVRENVGFGLKTAGAPNAEIERRVAEASRVLKLDDYLDRRPKALSGGQRQRVAIGRAIVREPVGFLFDEPLIEPQRRAQGRDAPRDRAAAPTPRRHHDLRHARPGERR